MSCDHILVLSDPQPPSGLRHGEAFVGQKAYSFVCHDTPVLLAAMLRVRNTDGGKPDQWILARGPEAEAARRKINEMLKSLSAQNS